MKSLLIILIISVISVSETKSQQTTKTDFPPFPYQSVIEGPRKGKLIYKSLDGSVFEKEIGSLKLFPVKLNKGNSLFELSSALPGDNENKVTIEYTRLNGETLETNDLINWYRVGAPTEDTPKTIRILSNGSENIEYLEISPNPSSNHLDLRFTLKSPAKLKISIVNSQGDNFEIANSFFKMGDNDMSITLERFPSGYYYLLIEGPGILQGSKFVISK